MWLREAGGVLLTGMVTRRAVDRLRRKESEAGSAGACLLSRHLEAEPEDWEFEANCSCTVRSCHKVTPDESLGSAQVEKRKDPRVSFFSGGSQANTV